MTKLITAEESRTKQYDITVKIRISVPTDTNILPSEYAEIVARDYSHMALRYRGIGADDIIRVDIEEV